MDALEYLLEKVQTSPRPEPAPDTGAASSPESTESELPPGYGKNNKLFTEEAANEARAWLRAKLNGNTLNSGIDPELMLKGLQLAGYHIEAGTRSFASYSKLMVKELGKAARPFLKMWYNSVRDYPGANYVGMTAAEDVASESTKYELPPGYGKNNKLFTEEAANEARAWLRAKLNGNIAADYHR